MKRSLVIVFSAGIIASPAAPVHAQHGHFGWHGHHHGHDQGYRRPRHGIPVYPLYVPPPVLYRPAPIYGRRGDYCPPRRHEHSSLPLIAGGIMGGVVGNEVGYGHPAAIIGGSVIGSVIGHELGQR